MGDLRLLALLVAIFYLSECFIWVPRGSVVFRASGIRRHRVVYPSAILGNVSGGLVFLNPLPPFGSCFVCRGWPISVSAEALYSYSAATSDPAGRAVQPAELLYFDAVRGIWPLAGDVLVNGRALLRLGNGFQAIFFAQLLTALWQCSPMDRERLIETSLTRSLDIAEIKQRVRAFRLRSEALRLWCHGLFLILLVALPASIWIWQIQRGWLWLGAEIVLCLAGIAVTFIRAYRELFDRLRGTYWRSLATMFCLPTSAIRSCDALSRDLLSEFHPLAVAAILCDRDEFQQFARRVLLDLNQPLLPPCPSSDEKCRLTELNFRLRLKRRLKAMLECQGHVVSTLISPPKKIDPNCVAFCPRCDQQFEIENGVCIDCGGVQLKPFPTSKECRPAIDLRKV